MRSVTSLATLAVIIAMSAAQADDSKQITLLCQTTGSNGERTGVRTVHIDLETQEVNDSQVFERSTPVVTNETHARITRVTDQVIAWRGYEMISHHGEAHVLIKFPYADQGAEDVVDRYTLTIMSPGHTSQCTLQTRKI